MVKKLIIIVVATFAFLSNPAELKLKEDKDIRIAIISHFAHVPAWAPVQKGIDDAAKQLGIKVEVSGPTNFSLADQVTTIQGKIASAADAIGTTMPDPQAFNDVVDEAIQRNIPVIAMNADAPESARLAYIGQSNYSAGYAVGKELTKRSNGGKVLIAIHSLGAFNLEERARGIKAALDEAGGYEYKVVETTTDIVRAVGLIGSWYQANKDAIAMLGVEEVSGIAISQIIDREELSGKLIGASFDMVEDVVNGIKNGTMTYTVDQQLYQQGYMSVIQLYLKVKYDITPSDIDTGATIIDQSIIDHAAQLAAAYYR